MKLEFKELVVAGFMLGVIAGVNGVYHFSLEESFSQVLGASTSHFGLLLAAILGVDEVCTTPDSLDVLMSKRHAIDPDYLPSDLVDLAEAEIRNVNGGSLRVEAIDMLKQMFGEMDRVHVAPVYVLSAFRTYQYQDGLKKTWLSKLGMRAERLSADAGHSEHQLGTTVDLVDVQGNELTTESDAWQWLADHAYRYGFVMTYREDNSVFTGYDYEPWHWRYVGASLATQIFEDGGRPERYYLVVGCR